MNKGKQKKDYPKRDSAREKKDGAVRGNGGAPKEKDGRAGTEKRTIVGTYFRERGRGFIAPDSKEVFKEFRDIFVPDTKSGRFKNNSKVVAEIKTNPRSGNVSATIIEVLGVAGEKESEVLAILRNYGFDEFFPENVLKSAENIYYQEDSFKREDLRNLFTITIDGEDAKDFDDSISLESLKGGGYKLWVHIADVSHYVKLGGAIDKEAFKRGTSVYFPSSVFPMLPETISNGVCSLRPGEEKLTISAIISLDKNGVVTDTEFKNTVTKSDLRVTYNQAEGIINGESESADLRLKNLLLTSHELAKKLKKKRDLEGSINFVTHEAKIVLDENGNVKELARYPYGESNRIIEEFMVLANSCVAKFLLESKIPSVYRTHEEPNQIKLNDFLTFIAPMGLKLNLAGGIKPKAFSDLLTKVKDTPLEYIVSKVMLRAMQKAKYTAGNLGHFGLCLEHYCHFTAPIRRYPDLMVHRALKSKIGGFKLPENFKRLTEVAGVQSSEREVSAEKAERDIDAYYKAVFMKDKIGMRFKGHISGVIFAGIFVSLENTVEGFIPESNLPYDNYQFSESRKSYHGTKHKFNLGDTVEVEVANVNIALKQVNFMLVI
ncbi:MAG: ribonuclease R [Firmicutes bacterium]|nr:ribonuclease R [Bacillota bacterium]